MAAKRAAAKKKALISEPKRVSRHSQLNWTLARASGWSKEEWIHWIDTGKKPIGKS